jgi:hypothetical protein
MPGRARSNENPGPLRSAATPPNRDPVIALPTSLEAHRVAVADLDAVCAGHVRYTPIKSVWFLGMLAGTLIGGSLTFSFSAFFLSAFNARDEVAHGHPQGTDYVPSPGFFAVHLLGSSQHLCELRAERARE